MYILFWRGYERSGLRQVFFYAHTIWGGGGNKGYAPSAMIPLKPGCTKVFCPQKYTHLAYFIKLDKGGLVILNNEIEQGIGLNLFFFFEGVWVNAQSGRAP